MSYIIGELQEGKLKGREFIIPNEVWVEDGNIGGKPKFVKTCLKHELLNIPTNGCRKCKNE